MQDNKIPASRMTPWMLVSLSAPIATLAGRNSWENAIWIAAACAVICYTSLRISKTTWHPGKITSAAEIIWLIILLGKMVPLSATCWNTESKFPVIPFTLLLLAGLNAKDGGEKASKAGAALYWITVLTFAAVMLIGLKSVKIKWLEPEESEPDLSLTVILLLSCVQTILPKDRKPATGKQTLILFTFTVLSSLWCTGCLGRKLAGESRNAFYESCKLLRVANIAERFESLIACVLSAGWFSVYSLILSSVHALLHSRTAVWGAVLTAGILTLVPSPGIGLTDAVISAVMWAILPIMAARRTTKKSQKK